jgi:hypothetical protein
MALEAITRWTNALRFDKLAMDAVGTDDVGKLVEVCTLLAVRFPDIKLGQGYKARQKNRADICHAAIDLGIDLVGIKALSRYKRGKPLIGRGLLDVWTEVLKERFGSAHGTNAWFEQRRRNVKTKMAKEGVTLAVLFKDGGPDLT